VRWQKRKSSGKELGQIFCLYLFPYIKRFRQCKYVLWVFKGFMGTGKYVRFPVKNTGDDNQVYI